MSEKKNTIESLMEKGKSTGKLTTKEITDALEELDFDCNQMDTFYDNCASYNIEIVEIYSTDADLKIGMDFKSQRRSRRPFQPKESLLMIR